MASANRRGSHDTSSQSILNSRTHRTGSIDDGLPNPMLNTSRRISSDSSSIAHVQATLLTEGPSIAFFGSCVINDIWYIHGGVRTRSDHSPSNRMYKYENHSWTDITTPDSPALSYHRCVVMNNGQFIVTIGGWDGSKRKSDVYVFDLTKNIWHQGQAPGFPSDGGLNNHSVIQMRNNETHVLVVGRDGSLRTQRRHGDAYCLRGDPGKGLFR